MKKQKEKHILTNQQGFTLAELLQLSEFLSQFLFRSLQHSWKEAGKQQIWPMSGLLMPKY